MQQTTKKQHFVPKMYLKHWSHLSNGKIDKEDNRKVYALSTNIDNNTINEISIDNPAFYEYFCYDIVVKDIVITKNKIEKELNGFENKHDRLLNRIIQRCESNQIVLDKGTNRLDDFMEFVGLLVVRNIYNNMPLPTSKDNIIQFAQDLADYKNKQTCGALNFTATKALATTKVIAPAGDYNLMFEMAKKFQVFKPDVFFLKAPEGSAFITSNNPVIIIRHVFFVPLSPKYLAYLVLDKEKKPSFKPNCPHTIETKYVTMFNINQMENNALGKAEVLVGKDEDDLKQMLPFKGNYNDKA